MTNSNRFPPEPELPKSNVARTSRGEPQCHRGVRLDHPGGEAKHEMVLYGCGRGRSGNEKRERSDSQGCRWWDQVAVSVLADCGERDKVEP